jgi:YHS domain-containing protein
MSIASSSRIRTVSAALTVVLLGLLAGCAAQTPEDTRPIVECPVCRENADLACLNVRVDPNTLHAEYRGRTYYFCSAECREEFLKNPGKYAK